MCALSSVHSMMLNFYVIYMMLTLCFIDDYLREPYSLSSVFSIKLNPKANLWLTELICFETHLNFTVDSGSSLCVSLLFCYDWVFHYTVCLS